MAAKLEAFCLLRNERRISPTLAPILQMTPSMKNVGVLLFAALAGFTFALVWSHGLPGSKLVAHIIVAAIVSLGFGHLIVRDIHSAFWLGGKSTLVTIPRGMPGWAMGLFERTLFIALTALHPDSVITWMGGWLVLKLGANWNRAVVDRCDKRESLSVRRAAVAALVCGTVSMSFAYLGGWIVCWAM